MAGKVYAIVKARNGHHRVFEGTVPQLTEYFHYTLECGNSWNHKISMNPKGIKSLLNNLDKCVEELQGGCFNRDAYWEASSEEIRNAKIENRYTNLAEC